MEYYESGFGNGSLYLLQGRYDSVRAVLLDGDGTNGGIGGGVHPDEFNIYDQAPEAVRLLN